MTKANYHTHTTYCDGKNTPRELVEKALELSLDEIGFSGHSYISFDTSYCMSRENTPKYRSDIIGLKSEYKDRIKITLGIEQDYYSDESTMGYEYVIGGVHYVKKNDVYVPVDESKELLKAAVDEHWGGDFYAFCEDYYALVSDLYDKTGCDIVAHFDLVMKFNEDGSLFDPNDKRYVNAANAALTRLLECPVRFEINTGAISRGDRTEPYPDMRVIKTIKDAGGTLLLSSDCHAKDALTFDFDKYEHLI